MKEKLASNPACGLLKSESFEIQFYYLYKVTLFVVFQCYLPVYGCCVVLIVTRILLITIKLILVYSKICQPYKDFRNVFNKTIVLLYYIIVP